VLLGAVRRKGQRALAETKDCWRGCGQS
jgi:hypothetical protein